MEDRTDLLVAGSDEVDVVRRFAELAAVVGSYDDLAQARTMVARLAQEALGSAGTAIWHRTEDSTMALDSFTDAAFMELMSDIVGQQPDGPAWQALQDRRTTVANDFTTETRWPRYVSRLVTESPVRSAVVYPLGVAGRDLGVLAVYSHQPHHFADPVIDLGAVFAAYASLALENIGLTRKVGQLEVAVRSHRRIGVAVGILMARNEVSETQAFDLLRVASQNSNTRLSDVADTVVRAGTLRTLSQR